jgi:uncharacterized repeat protein (TIGR01451 family)
VTPTKRPILAISLGVSLSAFVAILAAVLFSGASAEASSYAVLSSVGPNWTTAKWSCTDGPPGSAVCVGNPYPGSGGVDGDTATISGSGGTITVNSNIANAVTLNFSCTSCALDINSASAILRLTGTSTGTSGTLSISGGTLTNIGNLNMPNTGTFLFHGGTLNGNGTTNFSGTAVNFDGTQGPMIIDGGQTLNVNANATITLSGTNSLSIDNGSTINLNGGVAAPNGTLDLKSDTPIKSAGGQINTYPALSPGTLRKTGGTSVSNIAAVVNNGGVISISTGQIALLGGGTHTGQFSSSVGGEFQFNGFHLFNSPAAFGTPPVTAHVLGGVFDASTDLSFGGFLQDAGNTKLNNATLTMLAANPFKIYGGNLIGNGKLAGDLATDFGGNISPGIGAAAGTITVTGAFRQSALGFMTVKLTNAGVSDQVNIGGVATLNGGTFKASLNYAASDGDTWNVFTFASKIGDFATKNLPPYSRGVIQASYQPLATPTMLQLQAVPQTDIAILKTGPGSVLSGQNATYSVKVGNLGPATPANVTIGDSFSGGTFVSATPTNGTCSGTGPITCNLTVGGAAEFIDVVLKAGAAGTLSNSASLSSSTPADTNPFNDFASFTTTIGCPSAPTSAQPADGAFDVATGGSLTWSDAGAASYNVYLGRAGNGCSQAIGNVTGTSMPYALQQGTQYEWRVESVTPGCPTVSTACMKFMTINTCPTTPPALVAPTNGSTVSSPVTFSWTAVGAVKYRVFASVGGATPTEVGTTTGTSLTANIGDGAVTWYVVAEFPSPCLSIQSATGTFNTCTGVAPIPSLVSEVFTNQTYALAWKAITGAPRYEVDEALDKFFTQSRTTQTVTTTSVLFQHTVTVPTAFFYRVRAFIPCSNSFGPYSETMRIVLALVPSPTAPNPNVNVPVGSNRAVVQIIHIPGFPDGSFPFVATVDKPWLQVTPASGILPPEGIDLTVTADPTTLLNGTQTGTVIVTLTSSFGSIRSNGVTTVNVPVSVTLVTPVSPTTTKTLPPPNTLIVPSAGHLDGINSRWQSDVRLANVSTQSAHFQLTFTPDDQAKGVKQTVITADAGATVALDDIVRNWYGIGSLGEMANGMLEIRPLDAVNPVASSRTYNLTSNGTLGQFIGPVLFSKFIGKVTDPNALAPVLGLQQIAQNADYRTNFGLVEGSGNPVSLLVSVFSAAGTKLLDVPLDLKANEQRQLNGFLSQNNISLSDGRIEVKATGGDGKVTAYASVIDNRTGDPLLVQGVQLGQAATTDWVLPGVADINNVFASWRTDMDFFNSSSSPLQANLTFYSQTGSTKTATVTLNPGEVKRLDNVLQSTFATTNAGGAIHVTTANPASLVITGRTYDQTPGGTFGQFIEAVTAADAVGRLDRPLQILQAEDSVRYRTNVGIAEVTGKPVKVEVSVVLPDSKISPKTTFDLPANGFFQANVIQGLGLSNVYNVRVAVRAVSGDGKITAYGSVVDMKTQDPTFVKAQIDQQ